MSEQCQSNVRERVRSVGREGGREGERKDFIYIFKSDVTNGRVKGWIEGAYGWTTSRQEDLCSDGWRDEEDACYFSTCSVHRILFSD